MITFPNAKINIGLDIVGRRPDGYHDISTVMVPVDWHDVLEIVPGNTPEDTLTVTGRPIDCPPEKNLVMKAVRRLREEIEFPSVDVFLRKIIPDGAGLGGGSADAAFTLTTLNDLFSLGLSQQRLAVIAGELGADCAFFVYNRPMLCEGIGTEMSPIELPTPPKGLPLLLVKPPEGVSTAEAYAGVKPQVPEVPLRKLVETSPFSQWQTWIFNDFTLSVFRSHPLLGEIKNNLLRLGAEYASMSGSGSTIYGIFPDELAAMSAQHGLQERFKSLVFKLVTLGNLG